jgi:hypothetical protein
MSLTTLRTLLADKLNGKAPSTILQAGQSTGQLPMAFQLEEHTEHYLALESGEGKIRGMLTGLLAGVGGVFLLFFSIAFFLDGRYQPAMEAFSIAFVGSLLPFLWEVFRPLPLPILLNRRTRELYFQQDDELYHTPWDGIVAAAYEFHTVGPHTGGMRNAALEVLVHRFEHPEQQMLLSLGLPMGKTLELQQSFWEYLRAYMDNGPWFDEQGKPSASDAFIKSQLEIGASAGRIIRDTWERIVDKYKASGGKNYLDYTDVGMLIFGAPLVPTNIIQDFTYKVAKRRARAQWSPRVAERLRQDGPRTRLVDLEHTQGQV